MPNANAPLKKRKPVHALAHGLPLRRTLSCAQSQTRCGDSFGQDFSRLEVLPGKSLNSIKLRKLRKLMAWQWDRHSGPHLRTSSLAFMRRKYQKRSIRECTFASWMTFSPTLRTKVGVLNFSNDSTVFTRRFVLHRKVSRSVLCPFLTLKCPELMMISSRLCIVNRRLPVAILRGTRSAQPPIRSTSCVH